MKYVHASGPVDIDCDFEAVNELVLLKFTHSSFQYTEYFDLIHDFLIFFDKWLTVDTVQFYQCWVSRSIGSYPENTFMLPLDYYQADVEVIFEKYWNGIEPFLKRTLGCAGRDMSTPPVTYDTKSTLDKKKSGVSYPHTDLSPATHWDFDILKRKIIGFTAKNILHYGLFAALNAGNLIHGDKTNKQECSLASFDSGRSRQLPLPRTANFLEYTYFLLNMCHTIHPWVVERDKANTDSDAAPNFESMFDVCRAETKSQKGDSSTLVICVPNVFHLPSTRAMDVTAVSILVFLGQCVWLLNGPTQVFGRNSKVLRQISRIAVLPCLTAAEADNCCFQGLPISLNTPTFF
jgi:hypothetical protein